MTNLAFNQESAIAQTQKIGTVYPSELPRVKFFRSYYTSDEITFGLRGEPYASCIGWDEEFVFSTVQITDSDIDALKAEINARKNEIADRFQVLMIVQNYYDLHCNLNPAHLTRTESGRLSGRLKASSPFPSIRDILDIGIIGMELAETLFEEMMEED